MPYRNYNKPVVASPVSQVINMEEADTKPPTNGDAKEVPAWLSKIKEGGVKKVPKDVQKRRRNFRLKKMLTPKPPMMVLFELVNHTEVQFDNFIADPMSRLLKVTAHYDGKSFEGIGPNKSIAKNICSEQILQHIVAKSCEKDGEIPEEARTGSHGEEETPWTALASIALFKLFNDWQSQGVVLPAELMRKSGQVQGNVAHDDPMTGVSMGKQETDPKPAKKKTTPTGEPKQLPENPTSRHPVQLLNEMEAGIAYNATVSGAPPNCMFTMTVTCQCGQSFSGSAKNKKDAKKIAAQNALAAVYNVIYPQVAA